MTPSSLFEILRRKAQLNTSGTFSSGLSVAAGVEVAPRGLALGAHATDPDALALAQGTNFIGHLTRRVRAGSGLQLADRVFGNTSDTPVPVETADTDGLEVSVERAEEIEVEGSGYILDSGEEGGIDTNTAVGSNLSFSDGKLYVAQTGDNVYYTLTANNLTPNTAGNLRIRAVAV